MRKYYYLLVVGNRGNTSRSRSVGNWNKNFKVYE
jgi:hypothetical protein